MYLYDLTRTWAVINTPSNPGDNFILKMDIGWGIDRGLQVLGISLKVYKAFKDSEENAPRQLRELAQEHEVKFHSKASLFAILKLSADLSLYIQRPSRSTQRLQQADPDSLQCHPANSRQMPPAFGKVQRVERSVHKAHRLARNQCLF